MKTVGISILRADLLHYLNLANAGEEIIVTSHGKNIARILPPHQSRDKARQELRKLQQKAKLGDVISPIDEDWEVDQ